MSNVGEFPWSWFLGDRTQVQKEKENLVIACLRPLQQKSTRKKNLLFYWINLLLLWRFRCRRSRRC